MTLDNSSETPVRRPSRLASAWMALRGDPVIPVAIRAEWAAWQFELEALSDKVSNAAARLYQRDKRVLDAALARINELEAAAADPKSGSIGPDMAANTGSTWNPDKIALYRKARALTGATVPNANPILETNNVPSD
ncbi:hypothetical protein LCGC14_2252620 [marine sediment metagenome]|uniref:Uncharacterized protein n=1 Tax=marine sediment metagenome TaxID=412755 RepID=A0A0F9FX18_9ZZZZ